MEARDEISLTTRADLDTSRPFVYGIITERGKTIQATRPSFCPEK